MARRDAMSSFERGGSLARGIRKRATRITGGRPSERWRSDAPSLTTVSTRSFKILSGGIAMLFQISDLKRFIHHFLGKTCGLDNVASRSKRLGLLYLLGAVLIGKHYHYRRRREFLLADSFQYFKPVHARHDDV